MKAAEFIAVSKSQRRTLRHGEAVPPGEPKRSVLVNGYVQLSWRVGVKSYVTVYEHRLVAGLPPDGVVVHHINGIKTDNKRENLQTIQSQSEHAFGHSHLGFDIDKAIELYRSGLGCKRIAKLLGTYASSVTRALRKRGIQTRQGRPTHCLKGHLFTAETTLTRSDGYRECRICRRMNQKMARAARRGGRHQGEAVSRLRRRSSG